VPGYEASAFFGIIAPKSTPPEVIGRLNTEIKRLIALPDVRERLEALGFNPIANTPEEFGARIKTEFARWAKVIRDANIRIE
jgi:tripartite-type tricarboxylate transporter receptor subunit TctC